MKRFPGLKTLAFLCISLFVGACAVDRPPSGGPPDSSPLVVTASTPEPGSVNVSPTTIHLEFNRFVTTSALSKAIFFSPSIRNYQVTARGREADIRLFSPLTPGRTYTLTLKRSLKSFYGNVLAESWSLPFSTGPSIDTGTFEGKVWTRQLAPAPNITILAYAEGRTTSPMPAKTVPEPDYLTQTDANGNFRFESLAPGNYRVVALRDSNNNLRFDRDRDEFGVTATHVVATGTKTIAFRLAEGDTSAVSVRSVTPVNSREIELLFNRSLPTRLIDAASIAIIAKANGAPLAVLACFAPDRAESSTSFRLLTAPMVSKSTYAISLLPPLGPTRSDAPALEFSGGAGEVTWPKLTVTVVPPNQATGTIPELVRPGAGPGIELQFNLPVEESSLQRAVTLVTKPKSGEQPVPIVVSRYDSRTWTIRAVPGFEPATDYLLRIRPALISSPTGAKAKESIVESGFSTAGTDQYGEIAITGSTGAAELLVEARREGTSVAYRAIVRPDATGGFGHTFRNLPPGNYTVFAFSSQAGHLMNPASRWDPGSLEPFRPCDPFVAASASVRPSWTTDVTLPALGARRNAAPAETPKASAKPGKRTSKTRN